MCGIFGIVYTDGSTIPAEDQLSRSAGLIGHRGPDGCGVHAAPGIGLAHTRLSLVDLAERSDQPFWDAEQRHCVVYNGEIYNFQELREELIGRGVPMRTTSDTEVLLHLLILDGPAVTLPRLQGMFSFAFYRTTSRELILARDRFGIKPLFLYHDADRLLFGSEVKAMMPWMPLRPNSFQVIRYLMHCPAPVRDGGFFDGVRIVPAGSLVTLTIGGQPRFESFADLPGLIDPSVAESLEALTPAQAVDRVDELLQESVRRMLFADAPVGALCSGGVDSSLLMAMAARHHGNLAIFHANVVGPLSEYDAAATLSRHLKLDLQVVETRDQDFIDLTPDVIRHYEYPFSGHPHSIPFLMVSRLVKAQGVKAVLTGEGSDECFLGYNDIAYEPLWAAYHRLLDRLRRLVHRVPAIGPMLWESSGTAPGLVADLLGQFTHAEDRDRARETFRQRMGRAPDRNIRTLDLLSGHLQTLLHRNDTMGMAAGIEARFPFLSEAVVGTAINLPYRHKIRFSARAWEKEHPLLRDKWVLREVADRYLPRILSQRKKRGFDVSAFQRMRFDPAYFRDSFVARHFRLSRSQTDRLVASADQRLRVKLMMLEVWDQIFMGGIDVHRVRERLRAHASFS
jgi:asparagine synthase (glutamine-hydrolysing)